MRVISHEMLDGVLRVEGALSLNKAQSIIQLMPGGQDRCGNLP